MNITGAPIDFICIYILFFQGPNCVDHHPKPPQCSPPRHSSAWPLFRPSLPTLVWSSLHGETIPSARRMRKSTASGLILVRNPRPETVLTLTNVRQALVSTTTRRTSLTGPSRVVLLHSTSTTNGPTSLSTSASARTQPTSTSPLLPSSSTPPTPALSSLRSSPCPQTSRSRTAISPVSRS